MRGREVVCEEAAEERVKKIRGRKVERRRGKVGVQRGRLVLQCAQDHFVGAGHSCLVVDEESEGCRAVEEVGEGNKGGFGRGGGGVEA